MNALVEFLRARLDEDEQAARGASDGPWKPWRNSLLRGHDHLEHAVAVASQTSGAKAVIVTASWMDAEHIARHDPARVLADVEAKRRILEEHPHYPANSPDSAYWTADFGCGTCHVHQYDGGTFGDGWCKTLRLLALPFADHADYREEWRV